eukprot:1786988-Amphidinium_carterae.1
MGVGAANSRLSSLKLLYLFVPAVGTLGQDETTEVHPAETGVHVELGTDACDTNDLKPDLSWMDRFHQSRLGLSILKGRGASAPHPGELHQYSDVQRINRMKKSDGNSLKEGTFIPQEASALLINGENPSELLKIADNDALVSKVNRTGVDGTNPRAMTLEAICVGVKSKVIRLGMGDIRHDA